MERSRRDARVRKTSGLVIPLLTRMSPRVGIYFKSEFLRQGVESVPFSMTIVARKHYHELGTTAATRSANFILSGAHLSLNLFNGSIPIVDHSGVWDY